MKYYEMDAKSSFLGATRDQNKEERSKNSTRLVVIMFKGMSTCNLSILTFSVQFVVLGLTLLAPRGGMNINTLDIPFN